MPDSTIRNLDLAAKSDGSALIEVTEPVGSGWGSRRATLDGAMGVTATGRLLITAANAAAGRAALSVGSLLSGTGVPASGLGNDGDFYIRTSNSTLYGPKASGAWGSATSLVGASGAAGRTILSGTTAPASGTGADGDFYIRTSDWTIYGPKASGAWGSATSLVGPAGTGGSGSATVYGDPVTLTDAATVTPNTALLTSPGSVFIWTPAASRTLAAPTGVPTGKTQRVPIILKHPTSGNDITITLGTGITGQAVVLRAGTNLETRIDLFTENGSDWKLPGINLPPNTRLAADATGALKAMSDTRTCQFSGFGPPTVGQVYESFAPFAGTITGANRHCTNGTITGTWKIDGTNITGLVGVVATSTKSFDDASGANTHAKRALVSFTVTATSGVGTNDTWCVAAESNPSA